MKRLLILLVLIFSGGIFGFGQDAPPGVPNDVKDIAKQAAQSFQDDKFDEAQKFYQQILAVHPDNLYALSNLGVTLFRLGKLKPAEDTLKRAIAVAPDDEFSHCLLGVVYYSRGKMDEAAAELNKTLVINPKNTSAQKFLTLITNYPAPGASTSAGQPAGGAAGTPKGRPAAPATSAPQSGNFAPLPQGPAGQ
jgi:tetratricopeptide (TPR) repeat protein